MLCDTRRRCRSSTAICGVITNEDGESPSACLQASRARVNIVGFVPDHDAELGRIYGSSCLGSPVLVTAVDGVVVIPISKWYHTACVFSVSAHPAASLRS